MNKNRKMSCEGGSIDYPGVGRITDEQVAEFALEHLSLFDRLFRPKKIVKAGLISQNILMGVVQEPKQKWRFN